MDEVEGSGGGSFHLGKKISDKGVAGVGEVDYKAKAGTAWSHSYLNQKPWHPLSYPNQRRKWIAEQTHANRERRAEEVAREFAQEQEFFRQTTLFSKKEKEKVEMMKAVSFMYVRPPGYNAESAKAAEAADERKNLDQNNAGHDPTSTTLGTDVKPDNSRSVGDKKARPKDVFGRPLPTEEEFEALKNAPRLETGMPARVKPFGVEIRNVRCVRCGTFGHQSGDRECPLKDVIMPNEESRLKRDDPLTAIMAQTDSSEPLKWELKQKPGMSPPRGGFQPDDPNQQIVAEEIFDEYGGFLSGGDIPALLSNFSTKKSKKHSKHKSKHKRHSSSGTHSEPKDHYGDQSLSSPDSENGRERKRRSKIKHKKKKKFHSGSGRSDGSDLECHGNQSTYSDSEEDRERKRRAKSKHKRKKRHHSVSSRSDGSDLELHLNQSSSSDSKDDRERKRRTKSKHKYKQRYHLELRRPDSYDSDKHGNQSSDSEVDGERKKRAKGKHKEENRHFDSSDLNLHHRSRRR